MAIRKIYRWSSLRCCKSKCNTKSYLSWRFIHLLAAVGVATKMVGLRKGLIASSPSEVNFGRGKNCISNLRTPVFICQSLTSMQWLGPCVIYMCCPCFIQRLEGVIGMSMCIGYGTTYLRYLGKRTTWNYFKTSGFLVANYPYNLKARRWWHGNLYFLKSVAVVCDCSWFWLVKDPVRSFTLKP